jgi:predicted solute-binding protein
VIIGDRAIQYRQQNPGAKYLDLAAEWNRWTGLPFVFAVWAIRREAFAHAPKLADELRAAAKSGLAARNEIAGKDAFRLKYLTEHLYYGMGPEQKEAIRYFAENLVKLGKLEKIPFLEYV